jgi:hypothetical protein
MGGPGNGPPKALLCRPFRGPTDGVREPVSVAKLKGGLIHDKADIAKLLIQVKRVAAAAWRAVEGMKRGDGAGWGAAREPCTIGALCIIGTQQIRMVPRRYFICLYRRSPS